MSVEKQLQARKSVGLIRASKRRNVSSFVLHAFSDLTLLVESVRKSIRPVKIE